MPIVADLITVLGSLFAAYDREYSVQKRGWYAIACIACLVVIWHVAVHGLNMVRAKGDRVTKLFGSLAASTLVLRAAYLIVWGIANGARRASVDTEIIAYAILDVLAKPVFGTWLLLSHSKIPRRMSRSVATGPNGLGSEGRIRIGGDEGA